LVGFSRKEFVALTLTWGHPCLFRRHTCRHRNGSGKQREDRLRRTIRCLYRGRPCSCLAPCGGHYTRRAADSSRMHGMSRRRCWLEKTRFAGKWLQLESLWARIYWFVQCRKCFLCHFLSYF